VRLCALLVLAALAGCPKAGGQYRQSDREAGDVDAGETNGRMFDFVSNKPDGDDWQLRLRGNSLWASYSHDAESRDLGTQYLTAKETKKVWKLIDAIGIPEHDEGEQDDDEGYVQLRLREPGGDDGHDIFTIFVSRDTEEQGIVALREYLGDLIAKYHKRKRPKF
jgi:hypothetical protein